MGTHYICHRYQTEERKIPLAVIRIALGDLKTRALIGFHALSGADITDLMSGKGQISCWQAFSNDGPSIHEAFGSLGSVPLAGYCEGCTGIIVLYTVSTRHKHLAA